MGLKSKLGIEYKGLFFFAVFYLIAGVANLAILGLYGLDLFHVALVAVLSLIAAFGLYRLQNWSLWFVVALFFITTTYGALMLNTSMRVYTANPAISNLFITLVWVLYLLFTWLATVYIGAKRTSLR